MHDAMLRAMKNAFSRLASSASGPLSALFLFYGLVVVGIMSIQMPPYQNPDELHHLLRAEQLSRFGILPWRLSNDATGAPVESVLVTSAEPFLAVAADPGRKVTRGLYEATAGLSWGGPLIPVAFGNTVIYPPTFYVPAVAALWIGKGLGVPVVYTLYGTRLASGICATTIAALAILLADGAAPWLFAVLTLPMTLSLFCAVSQDGLMIACAALAAALLGRSRYGPARMSDRRFVVLGLLLAAMCMARPPYAPLACLVLVARWRSLGARSAGLALIGLATAAWSLTVLGAAGHDSFASTPDFDPARQLAMILRHPARMLVVLRDTLDAYGADYLRQLVGRLGYLDVPLPEFVYRLAWSVLALAAAYAAACSTRLVLGHKATTVFVVGCCIASVLLILGIQYLTFSSVAAPLANGVQGRYFIEVLLFLGVAVYSPATSKRFGITCTGLLLTPCLVIYLAEMVRATLLRYYF